LRAADAAFKPVNQARWARFRHNRRGYWSLWIFAVLFVLSLCSELIANDKPLLVHFNDRWYVPVSPTTAKATLAARLPRRRVSGSVASPAD
jgi:ABC-type microcin C transport system permease subunit YejE